MAVPWQGNKVERSHSALNDGVKVSGYFPCFIHMVNQWLVFMLQFRFYIGIHSQPLSLSIHIEWVLLNQIDYMKHLSISNLIYWFKLQIKLIIKVLGNFWKVSKANFDSPYTMRLIDDFVHFSRSCWKAKNVYQLCT